MLILDFIFYLMRFLLLFILTLLIQSCHADNEVAIQFPSGGYPYVKYVPKIEQDFYFYPVKDVISRQDSLLAAFYQHHFYSAFDEPNLSLQPPTSPVFRLTFESSFLGYAAVLTLTQKEIIVKEKKTGYPTPYPNEGKLDSFEREHLHLLQMHYPISEYKDNPFRKKFLDSLATVYPQLHDPSYYLSLLNKAKVFDSKPFTYQKWTVPISKKTYKKLIDSINQSGYWNMNYMENRCIGEATHPDGFMLEAATSEKFQVVNYIECYKASSFQNTCKSLMKAGKLDVSFKMYREAIREEFNSAKQ
jgi:hypothetical protein